MKRKEKPRPEDSVSQNEILIPVNLGSSENHSSDEEAPIEIFDCDGLEQFD